MLNKPACLSRRAPAYAVVFDIEVQHDLEAHGQYRAIEEFTDADAAALTHKEARNDPRVVPRWPFHRIVTMSWLVLTDGPDGLRPIRLETRGCPEADEAEILKAFFADMEQLGSVHLYSWGGYYKDWPQILFAAMASDLELPKNLQGLLRHWRRGGSGHTDIMTDMAVGAKNPHLAEVAAGLGIPAKLTCRPDLVSRAMERGKWSDVKEVCEGDVLSTLAMLMLWRRLEGRSNSRLEGIRRLTTFVAKHLSYRRYAATWIDYGERLFTEASAREASKIASFAPHLVD